MKRWRARVVVAAWLWAAAAGATEGDPLWTRIYNGSDSYSLDDGISAAFDSAGNLIVGGSVQELGGNYSVWVRKYDATGSPLWTFTGDGSQFDWAHVAVDSADRVQVLSRATLTTTYYADRIWLGRISAAGALLWSTIYADPNPVADELALDAAGNIFLTGSVAAQSGWRDLWVAKLDAVGVPLWATTFDNPGAHDEGKDVVVGTGGRVYVIGTANYKFTFVRDILLTCFDDLGGSVALSWSRTVNYPSYYPKEEGNGLALAPDGSLVACGTLNASFPPGGSGVEYWWLARYGPDGRPVWIRDPATAGSANLIGKARAVAVDSEGGILVTGDPQTVRRYSSAGELIWSRSYPGADPNIWYYAYAIAAGPGRIAVAGEQDNCLTPECTNVWVMMLAGAVPPPAPPAIGSGRAPVYPQPYSASSGAPLRFGGLRPDSVLGVYTLAGERVVSLTADAAGIAIWRGENRDGTRVAPGVYLYRAVTPVKAVVGKFVVTR